MLNVHVFKPLDVEIVDKYLECVKLTVAVEEHSTIEGLSGSIAEYKAIKAGTFRQVLIGSNFISNLSRIPRVVGC